MIIQNFVIFFFILTFCEKGLQKTTQSNSENLFNVVDTCECGKNNDLSPRIVGGKEVDPNAYPWMAAIFNKGKLHCGASLINDRYILTAGHCLKWSKKEDLSVVLGMNDRLLMETYRQGGTVARIDQIIIHEKFTSEDIHDIEDIALIKLKTPVKFNFEIGPICLPKPGQDYSGKNAMVTGWGRMAQNGQVSDLLRKAKVKVITNEECKNVTIIGEHILPSMLCAYEPDTDACQGDSGGPLIYEDSSTGRMEQIGVVAWGIGCAKRGVPGVYTRITSYLDWLASHTRDALYCKDPL